MEKIPNWVKVGQDAKIHPSVNFVPIEGKTVVLGKRCKIDSNAVIYGGVEIGNDSIVGHSTVLRSGTKIGVHSTVANLCVIEGNLSVGSHTLIHSNNHLGQKTTVGDYVFMAPLCVTTNDPKMYYYRKEYNPKGGDHWKLLQGPTIHDGARIAAGVTFLPGVIIGKQAVIGAGSVVTRNVPDFTIVFGAPAKVKGKVEPTEDIVVNCTRDHS
jgi:acetyltransferase-like isoleucine patch superfamily enzyme